MSRRRERIFTRTGRRGIRGSRRTRLRIPPRPDRPFVLHQKDLLRPGVRSGMDDIWFTEHRAGPRRTRVGVDPLEARAVPESQVKGYLHERIVWKFLVAQMRFVVGVDFTYQSSQFGGRLELGGLVADFLFPYLRMIIEVEGPLHQEPLLFRKDEERRLILEDMGYRVFYLPIDVVASEQRLNEWMRRVFSMWGGGGSGYSVSPEHDSEDPHNQESYDRLYQYTFETLEAFDVILRML